MGDRVYAFSIEPLHFLSFLPGLFGGHVRVGAQSVPSPFAIRLLETKLPAFTARAADHEIKPVYSIVFAVFLSPGSRDASTVSASGRRFISDRFMLDSCMVRFDVARTIYGAIHRIKDKRTQKE